MGESQFNGFPPPRKIPRTAKTHLNYRLDTPSHLWWTVVIDFDYSTPMNGFSPFIPYDRLHKSDLARAFIS